VVVPNTESSVESLNQADMAKFLMGVVQVMVWATPGLFLEQVVAEDPLNF
jgi:hypothetical protein